MTFETCPRLLGGREAGGLATALDEPDAEEDPTETQAVFFAMTLFKLFLSAKLSEGLTVAVAVCGAGGLLFVGTKILGACLALVFMVVVGASTAVCFGLAVARLIDVDARLDPWGDVAMVDIGLRVG